MANYVDVRHWDGTAYVVRFGAGEDIAAPREIAKLVAAGWPEFDMAQTVAIKAWLAGRRVGLIEKTAAFADWAATLEKCEAVASRESIEEAVAVGAISAAMADMMRGKLDRIEASQGEAVAPPA